MRGGCFVIVYKACTVCGKDTQFMTVYTVQVMDTLWGVDMLCNIDAYIIWAYTMTNIHRVG